eukprot:gene3140-7003_t
MLEALEHELGRAQHPLVLGDLNMNTRLQNPHPRQLMTLFQQYKLRQRVPFVTRPGKKPGRGSTLDHVWASQTCRCTHIPQLSQHSDHLAIRLQCGVPAATPPKPAKYVWRRRWDRVKVEQVEAILDEELRTEYSRPAKDGGRVLKAYRPRDALTEMQQHGVGARIEGAADRGEKTTFSRAQATAVVEGWERAWLRIKRELAPRVRTRVRRAEAVHPWLTEAVRGKMRARNQLYRRWQQAGDASSYAEYKQARGDTERAYKVARRDYIRKEWSKAGNKTLGKEQWRLVNRLAGRKVKQSAEPDCTPEAVNDAFMRKVERIRAPLRKEPDPAIQELRNAPVLTDFEEVNGEQVRSILGRIKGTRSAGVDEVPMAVLKKMADV